VVVARGEAGAHTPFADLLGHGDDAPRPDVGSNEVVELIFTSGTTRKPKAVMLTHSNCVRAGLDAVHCLWLDEGERCLTALPLFHVNAQAMSVMAALTVGGTLILVEEFRASRFWAQVRSHRATQTSLVAMQLRTLLAQPPDDGDADHSVRRLFYAINVTDDEKERFEARYGVALINGYGLSEAMTLLTCAPVVGPRAGRRSAFRRLDGASRWSTTRATRWRPARSARSSPRARRGATSCSATSTTRSRPPRRCAAGACTPATTRGPTSRASCTSSIARRT
jgi:acyl-CoA synthetase (AMP-forming)/AMP-acid ligase II